MSKSDVVDLWRSRDGLWRYRYVPPEGGPAIRSNRAFLSRQEALDSIRIAFPGVAVREIGEPLAPSGAGGAGRRRLVVAAVGAGVVLIAARAVKAALRARRALAKMRRLTRFAALVAAAVDRRRPPDG